MSLFETEVAEYSRTFIRGMNALEACRTAIDRNEQLGEILREAGIASHSAVIVHDHYNPPQLGIITYVYRKADGLARVVEILEALISSKNGKMSVGEDDRNKIIHLDLPGVHRIDVAFEASDITRDLLVEALEGRVAA